jgi:hypothetical protein
MVTMPYDKTTKKEILDKASIQDMLNEASEKEQMDVDLDRCKHFAIETGEKETIYSIPEENKYLFVGVGRFITNEITGDPILFNNPITIDYEITIDKKQYIATGAIIYSGGGGGGHYLYHSLKQEGKKAVSDVEFNDSNVVTIDKTSKSNYDPTKQGILYLYKRKDAMTGGVRRLGLSGRTMRTSRIAPEQSSRKRTLKAQTSFIAPASKPSPTQTRRRPLKARTTQSRTERSRGSGRLPIRRAAGK